MKNPKQYDLEDRILLVQSCRLNQNVLIQATSLNPLEYEEERKVLIQGVTELMNIFGSILRKSE